MNKKIFLLALACTVPSFMFGQVPSTLEKGLQAGGKAAGNVASAVTDTLVGKGVSTVQAATDLTTAVATATDMSLSTGMRVGTLGTTGLADVSIPTIPAVPSHVKVTSSKLLTNIGNKIRRYRNLHPVTGLTLGPTPGFKLKRINAYREKITDEEIDSWKKQGIPDQQLYGRNLVIATFAERFLLSAERKAEANEFFVNFLNRENAFSDFENFVESLTAVTGLFYTGDESTATALVQFALRAPEQYTYLTDFVVIPVLRMKGQYSKIKELATHRSYQEKWAEGNKGPTYPLYRFLIDDIDSNSLLSDHSWRDLIPLKPHSAILPGEIKPFSSTEEFTKFRTGNPVLREMGEFAGNPYGWTTSYANFFHSVNH